MTATIHHLNTAPHPHITPPLAEEEAQQQARLLKALAEPTRLRILSLLRKYEGDMNVCELVRCFQLEQPTVSHHLTVLRNAGLIDARKVGLFCYYYLKPDALHRALVAIQAAGGLL